MSESDAIKGLIDSIPGKTLAAKLRSIMPEIDKRVREGVQHEEIIETLNASGFDLNLNTFRSNLYRYRRKLRGEPESPVKVRPVQNANGNLQTEPPVSVDESPEDETVSASEKLDELFSAQKRGDLGDKYINQSRPILGKNRSPKE